MSGWSAAVRFLIQFSLQSWIDWVNHALGGPAALTEASAVCGAQLGGVVEEGPQELSQFCIMQVKAAVRSNAGHDHTHSFDQEGLTFAQKAENPETKLCQTLLYTTDPDLFVL